MCLTAGLVHPASYFWLLQECCQLCHTPVPSYIPGKKFWLSMQDLLLWVKSRKLWAHFPSLRSSKPQLWTYISPVPCAFILLSIFSQLKVVKESKFQLVFPVTNSCHFRLSHSLMPSYNFFLPVLPPDLLPPLTHQLPIPSDYLTSINIDPLPLTLCQIVFSIELSILLFMVLAYLILPAWFPGP